MAAVAAFVAFGVASRPVWGAGLASTEWPMFHRDAAHSGNARESGPAVAETRWWQGGDAILPYEADHVPHGPQGAMWSSAATSEVDEDVPGAKKVWYFHYNAWTGRGAVPPGPTDPLVLRSEFPDDDAYGVPILAAPTEVFFETSTAMQFAGASGDTLNSLLYRNQDPNSRQEFVKQTDGTYQAKMRIPAGLWTFDFWITDVPAATNINFTIYRFAHATPDTRTAVPGLDPVTIPIPQTPNGALRRIEYVHRMAQDALLQPTDGIAIGVSVEAGSAVLVVEGRALSRVETPIQVPAVYAGADDGSVWAFDASTGNVLWSSAVPDAWFRSSPAVGDDGSIYIGSYEGTGRDLGRLYAFNPNGTVKWTYPAVNQIAYFRSGYLSPDLPADFPTDTAPLYPFPGSGTDPNPATIARTATEAGGRYVQFIPRTTNAAVVNTPPAALTQAGWLFHINDSAQERTLNAGEWVLDLALRADVSNTQQAAGFITYRMSKVTIDPGGPSLVLEEELLGWTQDTRQLLLPAGQRVWTHIETPSIHEAHFVAGEYIFVELMIRQVTSTGSGTGGWELLLEGNDTQGGSDSQLITPGLSQTSLGAISSSPVISGDDVVYFGTHGGFIHAVEAVDGSRRWARALRQGDLADEIRSSPAYSSSGKVYVGSMNGRLYALDGNDGGILWRFPVSGDPALGSIESSPALDADREHIYFGANDGNVYCVQPVLTAPNQIEGQLQWAVATGGRVTATPAVGPDGTVYIGSLDGFMYALNPNGTPAAGVWPFAAAGEIQSSAAIAAPVLLYFVNEIVTDDPPQTPRPRHLSTLRAGDRDGDEPAGQMTLAFYNPAAAQVTLPDEKFDQEFRTHPQASESGMPSVLPRGTYTMNFWARADLQPMGDQAWLYFKVFHCTPSDATGSLILSFPAELIDDSTSSIEYESEAVLAADATLDPEDYLRVEVWGRVTLGARNRGVLYFSYDGNFTSRLEGPSLIYFATSVLRVAQPAPLARGRVYCVDQAGRAVWVDPNDGLPGFNPRGGGALSEPTAFTASPGLWEGETTRVVSESGGEVTEVARRRDALVYLGGHDGIMYAFGPAAAFGVPPPVVPPPVITPSVLTLTKQADKEVADVGQEITYTLRFRNDAGLLAVPAEDVVIADVLPAELDYVDGSASNGGYYVVATGTVMWPAIGELWPQETGEVSFRATVNDTVQVIPPLEPPEVYVSRTDPVTQGVTEPLYPWDPEKFAWGDMLYVFLGGRGKPGTTINSGAVMAASTGEQAIAQPVTVYAGWGKRYRVVFTYDPVNDPAAGTPPENQPLSYAIEYVLTAADSRSGRPEEAYEYEDAAYPDPRPEYIGENLGLTAFKIHLAPRGYAYSPNAVSVTEPPNRPWTPYYWRLSIEQNRGGSPGREDWGPLWAPNLDAGGARTQEFDFMIHNPLEVTPVAYDLAGGAAVNPGTQTQNTSFAVVNISKQSITGTGPTYPRNVVRWSKVDLAQAGGTYPSYEFRDENYLAENRINIGPDHASLGPGQSDNVWVWGDIPRYLSPGIYQAPNLNPLTSEMAIYVDLNGNMTWDPGETKFENEFDFDVDGRLVEVPAPGGFAPFQIAATLSLQPWLRIASETVDAAKAPPGTVAGVPMPALLNLGNLDLNPIQVDPRDVDPLTGLAAVRLERADLTSLQPTPWEESRPTYWDIDPTSVMSIIAKTPVGAVRPDQGWLLLDDPANLADDLVVPHDQPSGTYSAPPDAVATAFGVTTRDGSPVRVRVVERRLTGYDNSGDPVLGVDVDPCVTWVDPDTLRVFWSSNHRTDGTEPTEADPYMLWYDALDRPTDAWAGAVSYPAPAWDPMDVPAGWISKGHLTPGHGVDADGNEWLFWGGSALRQTGTGGHTYDNRLLWASPWQAPGEVQDLPDVAGASGNPANMSDVFRLRPRPVLQALDDGVNEYDYVVFSEHSTTQASALAVLYRSRPAGGGAWSGWARQALVTSAGLEASRHPSAFGFDGYLWVVFSGASQYHGNYDIYCARYEPGTLAQAPFARFSETLTPGAGRTVFASRHKEWVISDPPVDGEVNIYVGGVRLAGAPVDLGTGRYRINDGTYNPEFDPALGTVYFSADPLAEVTADYTPKLLRLTTDPADESNPSAFVETYRYLDGGGAPQPVPYDPRLWVFWTQGGQPTAGADIMYLSLREALTYYFHDEASAEPATAGQLHQRGPDAAGVDLAVGAGIPFDTQAATPDVTAIPEGVWAFNFTAYGDYADYATENAQIYFRVYRRSTPGNVNALLFQTALSPKLDPVPRQYTIVERQGPFALNATDRIYVEVLAVVGGSAQAHFIYEGGSGSRLTAPLVFGAERAARAVPVDHRANELGLYAVKDPRYAQVWLFWTSTRGAPTGPAGEAAADSDVYYQAFDPELP